ncbi:hypothetical protein MMC10_004324 [Thelotrema lepadinum]|nr:hypothetical protein [Thelotrema lepadinum]
MASFSTCYAKNSNTVHTASNAFPCGNDTSIIQPCCADGHVCDVDSFCHFTGPSSQLSGFYLAGCTDPTFKDPKCTQQCSKPSHPVVFCELEQLYHQHKLTSDSIADVPSQDVVYNVTTGLWACCYGSGSLDCEIPSNETFQGPSVDELLSPISSSSSSSTSVAAQSTSTSTSSGSPSTSVATTTASQAAITTVASTSPSSGLSTGAIAGIAVGVFTAFAIFLAALAFFILAKRKSKKSHGIAEEKSNELVDTTNQWRHEMADSRNSRREHVHREKRSELSNSTRQSRREIDGAPLFELENKTSTPP